MDLKDELITLIEQLPEEQIPQAILIMKKIIKKHKDNEKEKVSEQVEPLAPLDVFMATIVNSLTNVMYDLSLNAKRKEEKVLAKRLESYRKKISDGWDLYKKNKN